VDSKDLFYIKEETRVWYTVYYLMCGDIEIMSSGDKTWLSLHLEKYNDQLERWLDDRGIWSV
jgi:hypothetical protein